MCEKLLVDFRTLSDVPTDPFRLVRTLKVGKDLYDQVCKIAQVVSTSKPAGFPAIQVAHSPFCPPGHVYGLDVNGKVVLMLGPK